MIKWVDPQGMSHAWLDGHGIPTCDIPPRHNTMMPSWAIDVWNLEINRKLVGSQAKDVCSYLRVLGKPDQFLKAATSVLGLHGAVAMLEFLAACVNEEASE